MSEIFPDARAERLLGAVGWRREHSPQFPVAMWRSPEGDDDRWYADDEVPDPYSDEEVCETLILFMNAMGYWVLVNHFLAKRVRVTAGGKPDDPKYEWRGESWKHGVCEIFLQMMDFYGSDQDSSVDAH